MPIPFRMTSSELTIDLKALAENWAKLDAMTGASCRTAAVVKADAYGLGLEEVAPALARQGCTTFYVAHFAEALALRSLLPEVFVFTLNGLLASTDEYLQHSIVPVINSLSDLNAWSKVGSKYPTPIHFDTGMSRLGLDAKESEALTDAPEPLAKFQEPWVFSHLASAEEPDNLENDLQLEQVQQLARHFGVKASFANSSGLFLGEAYHFDQRRRKQHSHALSLPETLRRWLHLREFLTIRLRRRLFPRRFFG